MTRIELAGLLEHLAASILAFRYHFESEKELQDGLERVLSTYAKQWGFELTREHRLSPKDRPDFLMVERTPMCDMMFERGMDLDMENLETPALGSERHLPARERQGTSDDTAHQQGAPALPMEVVALDTERQRSSERRSDDDAARILCAQGDNRSESNSSAQESRPSAAAIEVKVSGSLQSVTRQLFRYADYGEVSAILLVTSRKMHDRMPAEMNGKPVLVVCLPAI